MNEESRNHRLTGTQHYVEFSYDKYTKIIKVRNELNVRTFASRWGLKSMVAAHVLFTFYYECILGARIRAQSSEWYIDKEATAQKKIGGFWTRFFFILGNVIAVFQRIHTIFAFYKYFRKNAS